LQAKTTTIPTWTVFLLPLFIAALPHHRKVLTHRAATPCHKATALLHLATKSPCHCSLWSRRSASPIMASLYFSPWPRRVTSDLWYKPRQQEDDQGCTLWKVISTFRWRPNQREKWTKTRASQVLLVGLLKNKTSCK